LKKEKVKAQEAAPKKCNTILYHGREPVESLAINQWRKFGIGAPNTEKNTHTRTDLSEI
jgi:hypothetical protein